MKLSWHIDHLNATPSKRPLRINLIRVCIEKVNDPSNTETTTRMLLCRIVRRLISFGDLIGIIILTLLLVLIPIKNLYKLQQYTIK
jgi:hypothetical protein